MTEKNDVECCDVIRPHQEIIDQVFGRMPKDDCLYEMAELFKVFGDFTRIKILCVLFEAETCVCDLAELLGISQSAVSHQLRVLKQAKLVKNRRDGKTVYYSLADNHVWTIFKQGLEHIME